LLDFALISELAYFDAVESFNPMSDVDRGGHQPATLQNAIDLLFPQFDFQIVNPVVSYHGPQYIEMHSNAMNLTVLAIRGDNTLVIV
jgi:hypothetical protein